MNTLFGASTNHLTTQMNTITYLHQHEAIMLQRMFDDNIVIEKTFKQSEDKSKFGVFKYKVYFACMNNDYKIYEHFFQQYKLARNNTKALLDRYQDFKEEYLAMKAI